MTQKITPPRATALLNAAIDETKHCRTLQEALEILKNLNEQHPESMAAMWYRLNYGRQKQVSKLANRLPKVAAQKQREKDLHDARVAWKICTPERILQEIKRLDPHTKYTLDLGKEALLELLSELIADKAKTLKKEK